jgi:hypothetical protein
MNQPKLTEDHQRTLTILNQIFQLEAKIVKLPEPGSLIRHVDRIKEQFSNAGFTIEDPKGEPYNETRTDCDASIAGTSIENLFVKDVVKPLIRYRDKEHSLIVQRAVVVVEGRD